jgi:anti-sigma factor RsiW
MNMCAERYIELMHDYLDGDITRDHELELKKHLQACEACREHLHELNDTVAFIKSATHISAPVGTEEKVMNRLPKKNSTVGIQKWFRRHPGFVAAAVFFLFMSATLVDSFSDDNEFSVTKQPNVIVEGQTVTVPAGEVVQGDLVVKNGDLVIEGEVDGNVTIINGNYMASSAVVTGQIAEIDQTFERLWYEMKEMGNSLWTTVTGK